MNTYQKEAIANADAHLNNAVLPMYSELAEFVTQLRHFARLRIQGDMRKSGAPSDPTVTQLYDQLVDMEERMACGKQAAASHGPKKPTVYLYSNQWSHSVTISPIKCPEEDGEASDRFLSNSVEVRECNQGRVLNTSAEATLNVLRNILEASGCVVFYEEM